MTLNHRVVAMVGGSAKRVVCLTCNKQHNYRAPKATGGASIASKTSKKPSRGSSSTKGASGSREWQTNVADRNAADFLPYSIHQTFEPGQLVKHPKFGSGYVKETLDAHKLCVLFKDGPRTLVHGRSE